jgi:uroporphyrinogen-III synthase
MTRRPPLTDRVIVITRPREQAETLATGIRAQGGIPFLFPLLEIGPAPDPAPLIAAAAMLEDYAFAVFVSPNAARYALPTLLAKKLWPAGTRALAVGEGTGRALEEAGVACLFPEGVSGSERLLALPELAAEQVAGRRAVIFRADGGRELLGATLTARGAQVTHISCYHRGGPKTGVDHFLEQLAAGRLDALTLSSSEALGHLLALAGPDFQRALRALPLFVSHPRIADKARTAGFQQVIRTLPAEEGLLAGLCAYNWV